MHNVLNLWPLCWRTSVSSRIGGRTLREISAFAGMTRVVQRSRKGREELGHSCSPAWGDGARGTRVTEGLAEGQLWDPRSDRRVPDSRTLDKPSTACGGPLPVLGRDEGGGLPPRRAHNLPLLVRPEPVEGRFLPSLREALTVASEMSQAVPIPCNQGLLLGAAPALHPPLRRRAPRPVWRKSRTTRAPQACAERRNHHPLQRCAAQAAVRGCRCARHGIGRSHSGAGWHERPCGFLLRTTSFDRLRTSGKGAERVVIPDRPHTTQSDGWHYRNTSCRSAQPVTLP